MSYVGEVEGLVRLETKKKLFHVWLVKKTNGLITDVLIKRNLKRDVTLNISDFTVEAESITGLLRQIEKEWNVVCFEKKIQPLYAFTSTDSENAYIEGSLLQMELSSDQKSLIENSEWKCTDVYELEEIFRIISASLDLKESFYSLIDFVFTDA